MTATPRDIADLGGDRIRIKPNTGGESHHTPGERNLGRAGLLGGFSAVRGTLKLGIVGLIELQDPPSRPHSGTSPWESVGRVFVNLTVPSTASVADGTQPRGQATADAMLGSLCYRCDRASEILRTREFRVSPAGSLCLEVIQ
jgi:hypothetical protein